MGQRHKVLVIEDDFDLREMLADLLVCEGYEVAKAGDVAGAGREIQRELPDVVILDIGLPDGDGYDLCRRITEDSRTSAVPVLILTGKTSLDSRMRGFINGARKYITKPFDLDYLVETVNVMARGSVAAQGV